MEPGAGDESDHDDRPAPRSKKGGEPDHERCVREIPVPKPETAPKYVAALTSHDLQKHNAENGGFDATTMSDDAIQKRIDEIRAAPMAEEVVPHEGSLPDSDVETVGSSEEGGLPYRPYGFVESQKLADRIQELQSKLPGPQHLLCHPGPSKVSASQVDGEPSF